MFFHPECLQGVQSGAAVTGGLMATASFVYWYGRRHVWSRPSEFTVPVLRWLWWEACEACYQNASPTLGKHELLMQISAMQKSKGRACVWLKPYFGALSGSWINGAIGPSSAPALPSRETLENQPHFQLMRVWFWSVLLRQLAFFHLLRVLPFMWVLKIRWILLINEQGQEGKIIPLIIDSLG